ncbi:hypothetical protein [Paenibacillus sp. Marseille-Q4541]|uniref:hypothetical protein n=1 Tax=Paenibacillus sp. Marseille-Q4541 TaxID=2831522 RepID=UPI001BA4960A|nr:hypothetical protein [Paenibacillus sp. Marseille-Q4541]
MDDEVTTISLEEDGYKLITFKDGSKIYIKSMNEPSDEARKNLNRVFNELIRQGKL